MQFKHKCLLTRELPFESAYNLLIKYLDISIDISMCE